ncbi:MAG: hypothetical protein ACFHWZ_06390 [Phycisphaerales bacterium]
MKRTLTIVGIVVLLLAIGVGTYFVLLARGIGGVDDWTVRKVVTIVNTSLEPQLAFDSVSLSIGADQNEDGAPYAINFDGITLTAPDGTEVVSADSLRVALTEMPTRGQPIAIANITLGAPEIRLIREQQPDGTTGFRGLVPFVKPNPTQRDVDPETEGTTTLSDVLDLREVLVDNASIVYEDRTNPDLQAMRLDGIGFDLKTQPEQTAGGRTQHTLDIAFGAHRSSSSTSMARWTSTGSPPRSRRWRSMPTSPRRKRSRPCRHRCSRSSAITRSAACSTRTSPASSTPGTCRATT